MKYIYGPVKSRRLGLSLGITLTPYKTCSFDCVYCQLGKTTIQTVERKEYIPIDEILMELKSWFENNAEVAKDLNYITFAGAGEPALNLRIGRLIEEIKKISAVPITVITNSSLLTSLSLRQELMNADLIIPSLDAATAEVFMKISRPHENTDLEEIIKGLIELRKEFKGKIWLEVMLVKGLNDDIRHIKKLKNITDQINPDKIQLNSPVRTTAEPDIFPVDKAKLEKIKDIFGESCGII